MEELQTTNKGYYTKNVKKAIYRWRENHREQFNEYNRPISIKYYYKNAEILKQKKREKYWAKKEFREFLLILL
jgi:hypothetical protein